MGLETRLKELGLSVPVRFNAGVIRKEAEWFVGRELEIEGRTVQLAWFGSFSKDLREEWKSASYADLKGEAKKIADTVIEETLNEERASREAEWATVAKEAEELWSNATDRGEHPYLLRKKLGSLNGARIYVQEQGHPVILVPMRDASGTLWNVQRIFSKKFEGTKSDKFALKSGKKVGLFHLLGEMREASTLYICEGFATACSVHEAMGRAPTLVCFDAGNLLTVAEEFRKRYPAARFVFAADNDQFTRLANNLPYNTGREKALQAASKTNGSVVLPRFTQAQIDAMGKPSDWNDLHCLAGIKEVEEQITNPAKGIQEVVPLGTGEKGKKNGVSEKQVCAALQDYFRERIVAFDNDLFAYRQGHWNLLSVGEKNKIKQLIASLAPGYGVRDIDAAFKYFCIHCPTPPSGVNLFQPNPFAANFDDGTLHMEKRGGQWRTDFRPHAQADWLTYKLPFAYATSTTRNPLFDEMMENVWRGDSDQGEKVRLYKQVLGACLVPAFPIIVNFVGPPETGKSTLIKVAKHLVSDANWCSVDPSDFKGFLMEGMIGKLVNLHTDVDTQTPMRDSMVKRIIDRMPVQINRKNQTVVNSYMPGVHLFGSNDLLKTADGSSRAYGRRLIIIRTDRFQPKGNYDKDFDQAVWEAGPDGVIAAALEGLLDLLANNGHYHKVTSSKALVEEMQDRSDPIAIFLSDVDKGLVLENNTRLSKSVEGKIERTKLWEIFDSWRKAEDRYTRELGRNHFYGMIAKKGYAVVTIKGVYYYKGLHVGEPDTEKCKF